MDIKVSVIIPTFQRPALLIKCLTHLSKQSVSKEKFEVIVVTDGPDNVTINEVALFAQEHLFFNLSIYSLDEKKGPAAARNKGVKNAKGELIVFTDDDCLPHNEWLNSYWNAYKSAEENEVAFTGQTVVPHTKIPTDYENNIAHLETAEFITANCAIKKTTIEKAGGFDEHFPIAWREDSDLHFRLIKAQVPVYSVKNAIVVHPVRKANWGISLKEQKKSVFNALLYKKFPELYKQKISAQPLWNYYAMTFLFLLFIISIIRHLDIVAIMFLTAWVFLLAEFTFRRLKRTSKNISHVLEMLVTSALIPFLSVFWTLYGSIRYKTFFL